MNGYHTKDIRIEGNINIRQLDQFCMKEQINEHMSFSLGGYITVEDAEEYERKKLLGQIMRVYKVSDKEETIIGCGMVTEIEINYRDAIHYVLVKGYSCSYRMSVEKKCRSFQNPNWTYREVIQQIADEKTEIFYYHKEETLKFPVIQYGETDWDLLRRIGGQLQACLISDVISGKNRVFFGCKAQKVHDLDKNSKFHFYIQRDKTGRKKFCCTMKTGIGIWLGDTVLLDNKKWTVIEKKTEYRNGRVEAECILGRIQDWMLPVIYNPCLRGTSVRGRILKRKNESVKLWLEIDKDQKEKDAFWYPFLPESGNLMYAVPEEGAKAMIYFPDGKEKNGIVINSFLSSKPLNQNWNHFIKGIDIPACKEIKLGPDFIEIAGRRNHTQHEIVIGEETGIQLVSNKPIKIVAKEGVHIQSGLSCSATAITKITVKQTGEKNKIEMSGTQIISEAEKYYTSSSIHKSRDFLLERNNKQDHQSFHELYGTYIGMIARGDCGTINEKILGGIPVMGSIKGNIRIQNQEGLRIRRKS